MFAAMLVIVARAAHGAETVNVEIAGFAFDPPFIQVKAGTRIVFTNRDQVPHSVVGSRGDVELFRSPEQIDVDESYAVVVADAGEIRLNCGLHARISGGMSVEP